MENQSPFWKNAMIAGLYLGVILILYNVILYVTGQTYNQTLGLVSWGILAAAIVYFQIQYRNHVLGGQISYGKAVAYGAALMACAGIIQSVYLVVMMKFIDPSLLDQLREVQETALAQKGLSDDEIEAASKMMDIFRSPIVLAISGLVSFGFFGTAIALITSIFVKKDSGNSEYMDAMSELKSEE